MSGARAIRTAIGCVTLASTVVACGGSTAQSSASGTSSPSPFSASPSSSSEPESVTAGQLTVQAPDLYSGWTEVRRQLIPADQLNGGGGPICAPPGVTLPGARSTGAISEFSFNLQPDGGEGGHLVSLVFVQATAQDALQTQQRLAMPGYLTCMEQEAKSSTEAAAGPVKDASIEARSMPDSIEGAAARVTLQYTFRGSDKVMYSDFFDFVVGRTESRVEFSRCCSPFDDFTEAALVDRLNHRVAASALGK